MQIKCSVAFLAKAAMWFVLIGAVLGVLLTR
jgi:hypothetical protein